MTTAVDEASLRLWETYWHPICHRSEVANPRDFVRFDVAGEEVVAYHDGREVVVFDNLCPHRGARIFDGSTGNARFLCRYHGWSYANGKLFVGAKDNFDADALERLRLPTYAAEWVGDFLFASKSPAHSLSEQLAGLGDTLARVSRSCAGRADLNAYRYQADWRIAVENALEPYHVGAIHPDSLDTLQLGPGTNSYHGENSIWATEVGNDKMARKLGRLGSMFDLEFQHQGYWSIYLFPFSMISSTFGYSYSQQNFFPSAEPERCEFISRLYAGRLREGMNPAVLESFFESSAAMNRQVFEEDHDICKRVPLRSWSPQPPAISAKSEEKLVHFRASYRAAQRSRRAAA